MISRRQLIFIIKIVIFFVNPAISGDRGNRSSSSSSHGEAGSSYGTAGSSFRPAGRSQCFQFLFFGRKSDKSNANVKVNSQHLEYNENKTNVKVNSQYLEFCLLELNVAFKNEHAFDNFLHAFLYLKKAEFEKHWSIYSYATTEYYYDLLCTAHEMNRPYLMNPHEFCEDRYKNDEEDCLRSIEKIGCGAYVDGAICVKNLYFSLNKDDLLASLFLNRTFDDGTEDISDEDLANAINKGIGKYPSLSTTNLLRYLSDKLITREYYKELIMSGDPRSDFHQYGDLSFRQFRMYDIYGNVVDEDYYLEDARSSFYGIHNLPYQTLFREYNRRQRLLRQFGYQYAMYLQEQLQHGDRSNFKDRKQFCTTFLSKNPKYYSYLDD